MYYSTLYLAAQYYPGAGPEKWFNGKSSAENLAEARGYLEHWMAVTTSFGQGEYDSPNYLEEYVVALCLLSGWAEDPALRHKAHLLLDYMIYDYAVETLDGYYGGAHSRVYPKQIVAPGLTPSMALGWLLFGFGERQPNGTVQLLALSGYAPPPILERIARDRHQPYVERELKRTRWRLRNAGPESFDPGLQVQLRGPRLHPGLLAGWPAPAHPAADVEPHLAHGPPADEGGQHLLRRAALFVAPRGHDVLWRRLGHGHQPDRALQGRLRHAGQAPQRLAVRAGAPAGRGPDRTL
jgi:hypothetical protein